MATKTRVLITLALLLSVFIGGGTQLSYAQDDTPPDTIFLPQIGNGEGGGGVELAGFGFVADPDQGTVDVEISDSRARLFAAEEGPRILVENVELKLASFQYAFQPNSRLVIWASFRNITPNPQFNVPAEFFAQPFTFAPNPATRNIVSSTEPVVTNNALGGNGLLEPGESTIVLEFVVQHRNQPFSYYIDAHAVVRTNVLIVPDVHITAPSNLSLVNNSLVPVVGTVDDPNAIVTVNDIPAIVSGNGTFTAQVTLKEGGNTITAAARNASGGVGTDSIKVTLDSTPPIVTIDLPFNNTVTDQPSVTVVGMINDIVMGTVNNEQAQVTVNGIAATVSNRNFLAANVPLVLGPNTITAVGTDKAGNSASASVNITYQPPVAGIAKLTRGAGNNQTGPINGLLPQALVVALTDAAGNPAANKTVIFKVTTNNGIVSDGATSARSLAVTSNAQGQAQVQWTLGSRAGAGNNVVEATAPGFTGKALFTAIALMGTPAKINVDAGNNQTGEVNKALPNPFVAVVTDAGHNRLSDVPVTFTVVEGGGRFFDNTTSFTIHTDSDGRAVTGLVMGPTAGIENNIVEATFVGNTGSPARFAATAVEPGNPADTKVSGVVLDNSNVPIQGVTVHIEGTTLTAETDAQGQFMLQPAPVGKIHLVTDGATAQRPGSWPKLEFELVTVSGQNNTVGMPIYLLPLDLANQLCVDENTGGVLTLPQVPGFSLTVAPGSVTFLDGTKTGCISVTLVHADKVPMVPNFGQQPRFIVTIQPAGAHFSPAAPITIPNVDGLAPGEVTEMYSFDHDLGSFVAIGTGTVSNDGSVIASDPGVGVLKAGWHCGGNPASTGSAQNASVNITTPGPVEMQKNETKTITASGAPQPGTYQWTSSNPSIAEIQGSSSSASVSIKGKAVGTATLTVVYTCQSGASASASIQVEVKGVTIEITSLSPAADLILGENLTINYKIEPPGDNFDSVTLEIRNSGNTLVFKKDGLPTSSGTHSTTWENAKWNQAPHAGQFANPKNGPYEIKLIGKKGADETDDTDSIGTKLVIEADIKDDKGTASRASGLDDMVDALKIVLKLGGAEVVVSGAGSITATGANADEKAIKVDDNALNNLADGKHEVFVRDLRDEVGNFVDDDNNPANGVEKKIGEIELR